MIPAVWVFGLRRDDPAAGNRRTRATCPRASARSASGRRRFGAAINRRAARPAVAAAGPPAQRGGAEISRALLGQLARFLRAAGQKRPAGGVPRYRLSLGVRAVGLAGRYALRRLRDKLPVRVSQYVLLCDGMGTGSGAQSDAQEAISVLQIAFNARL